MSVVNLGLGLIICILLGFFIMLFAKGGILALLGGLLFGSGFCLYAGLFTLNIVIVIFVLCVLTVILKFKANKGGI